MTSTPDNSTKPVECEYAGEPDRCVDIMCDSCRTAVEGRIVEWLRACGPSGAVERFAYEAKPGGLSAEPPHPYVLNPEDIAAAIENGDHR